MSPTILFWLAGFIAIFPLTAAFVPLINMFGGIIALFASLGILVWDSAIPSSYVWKAILIFIISCFPFIRLAGRSVSVLLIGSDPGGRDVNLGDALIGSVVAIWYNHGWLEFASNHDGTWLIYLNWFLGCVGLWSFFGLVVLRKLMGGHE